MLLINKHIVYDAVMYVSLSPLQNGPCKNNNKCHWELEHQTEMPDGINY